MNKNVYFTTLGCSKNDVDTDIMRSMLENKKYNSVYSPEEADIIVVNTCGFIEAAKKESIDEILEMALYKENGARLLVSGCLAQRYPDELLEEIPEIDGILGTGEIRNIEEYIDMIESGKRPKATGNINSDYEDVVYKSEVFATEYVKIGEGCNNNCSYCIIPSLRGKNRSRSIESIKKEVEYLVENGAREIILIAQNTTDYGIDNYGEYSLARLLDELEKIEDLKWIRVLYLYPDNFNEKLINSFKNNKKLLPYVDIPLQHVSDNVLKNMIRHTDSEHIKNLIFRLREEIPEIIIRTTFIVGFPGESQEDFNELLDFIKTARFDKLGVFTYSREEGTPASKMDNQIDEETKNSRYDAIMSSQESISEENLEKFIGKDLDIIVEEIYDEYLVGRSYADSPEIDGVTYINDYQEDVKLGDFLRVKIIDTFEYDMIGEII